MKQTPIAGSYVLAGLISLFGLFVCMLSVEARKSEERATVDILRALRQFDQKLQVRGSHWDGFLKSLSHQLEMLVRDGSSSVVAGEVAATPVPEEAALPEALPEPSPAPDELAGLPPLPDGLNPVVAVRNLDIEKILADSRFNPLGKKLNRVDAMKVRAELTRAKAMAEILEIEAKVEITKGMEQLRGEGNFVEYTRGERYEKIPGAITAAEEIEPGRIRMFYLQPETFPELHAKKREKVQVAELSLRRASAIIGGSP